MPKAIMYICSDKTLDDVNYKACSAILEMCLFQVEIIEDRDKACRMGKGSVNPANGFVIALLDKSVIDGLCIVRNWRALTMYLDKNALIPCIY